MATSNELRIGQRFCGPPGTANGGFGCGLLAALLNADADVTLRRPLLLDRALKVYPDGSGLIVNDGNTLVAEARPSTVDVSLVVPAAVTAGQARAVAGTASYYTDPLFPNCFVCGPARGVGDGRCWPHLGHLTRRSPGRMG